MTMFTMNELCVMNTNIAFTFSANYLFIFVVLAAVEMDPLPPPPLRHV